MHYETVAALSFLVSFVLLWTSVFRLSGSTLLYAFLAPLYQLMQKESLPLAKRSSPSSEWNVELLLACMCQFYGPVRFNILHRKKAIKILIVMTTLSRLFDDLKYVGTIEVDEVLAYYLLLSELSIVKKRYPNVLKRMLMKWPLPKGNLTLSLLISTGNNEYTFKYLASYLPYISDKSARVAAVNYCLDACAEGSMYLGTILERSLIRAFEPGLVSKLKRISNRDISLRVIIAGSLLHFPPAELDEALVDDLRQGLAVVAGMESSTALFFFCSAFSNHPTTLWDSDSRQVIYKRNVQEFQAIPFSDEQRTVLSIVNKIKFGAVQEIKDMSETDRKTLFDILCGFHRYELVFHIWAREDVEKDGGWETFANDRSNTSTLSRLAFDLEEFFQNHFNVTLAYGNGCQLCCFLCVLNNYPSSSKKRRFDELLRAKVQEHPETILTLSCNSSISDRLETFFIDQGDKAGLMALNAFVSQGILDGSLLSNLDNVVEHNAIIWGCQLLHGRVDGVDPLQILAKRFGAAAVLRRLDFSRLRANDVGGMLRTLDISWARMNVALWSLSHNYKPVDELAAVLREFHNSEQNFGRIFLLNRHSLWFYLWKEHPEAFVEHVDLKIQKYYLPEESKLPKSVRRRASGLWR